jgi:benzoyl-CoA-dihydrodiol lyase
VTETTIEYSAVHLRLDRARRVAELTVQAPDEEQPTAADDMVAVGDRFWPLRACRELDDVVLRLRVNEPEVGTVLVRTTGDVGAVLACDETLASNREHWLVREILHFIKRTLKRVDLTARSFFALVEPGNAFGGTLFELALACDRIYMRADPDRPNTIALSALNRGAYPMSNGLSRLEQRFLVNSAQLDRIWAAGPEFDAADALASGLVTAAPDDLDWDDEVRLAIEERASLSPDALTAMEANLRFAGPETMETKIFGRLTAWQNWIFQRPNAVGEHGALKIYGKQGRPEFDWKRC